MKKHLLLVFALFFTSMLSAQTWDGGGDGTSWDDPLNWSTDAVPASDVVVTIGGTVTITGAVPDIPRRLTLAAGSNVTLNLDMSVGNGVGDDHCISLASGTTLTLASGKTLTLNTTTTKNGVFAAAANSGIALNISSGATFVVQQASNGIRFAGSSSTISNDGTIQMGALVASKGIYLAAGNTFNNGGTITIDKPADDGIETLGTFNNSATINVTAKDAAVSGNNGILVSGGTFVNQSGGVINANGGLSTAARIVVVSAAATLDNFGIMTCFNGNNDIILRNDGGTINNHVCAVIELTTGRLNNAAGTFNNYGYLYNGSTTNTIFSPAPAAANNYGFYHLGFGNWPSAATNDRGINVSGGSITYDAFGGCTIDVNGGKPGDVGLFDWYYGATLIGTNTADGFLTFNSNAFPNEAGPHVITTQCTGYAARFTVNLINICAPIVPVEMVFFRAEAQKDHISLSWQTASEVNNDYMSLERSSDGVRFVTMGRVEGSGTSYEKRSYYFEDRQPMNGINYYRLRQVDFDGTETLSGIVSAAFGKNGKTTSNWLFPTVVRQGAPIHIDLSDEEGVVRIVVLDAAGRETVSRAETANGVFNLTFDKILNEGTYLLQINDGVKIRTARFIVTR